MYKYVESEIIITENNDDSNEIKMDVPDEFDDYNFNDELQETLVRISACSITPDAGMKYCALNHKATITASDLERRNENNTDMEIESNIAPQKKRRVAKKKYTGFFDFNHESEQEIVKKICMESEHVKPFN